MRVYKLILYLIFFFPVLDAKATKYLIDYENLRALKPKNLEKGNIEKGKNIFISRKVNCLSCHIAPIEKEKFQGNVGPSLVGVGEKYSREQLRLIIINPKIINPDTIMPAYFTKVNYERTPENLVNKTIININEVEDLVEYLYSLKDNEK